MNIINNKQLVIIVFLLKVYSKKRGKKRKKDGERHIPYVIKYKKNK